MFTTRPYNLRDGFLIADTNMDVNQCAIIRGRRGGRGSVDEWHKLAETNCASDFIDANEICVRLSHPHLINRLEFKLQSDQNYLQVVLNSTTVCYSITVYDKVDILK